MSDEPDDEHPRDAQDLNPVLNAGGLPAEVARRREVAAVANARRDGVTAQRIEANLAACTRALRVLTHHHAHIAGGLDLDLCGYSRPAALWALSGRSLGLLRAILVQIGGGVCHEVVPTVRALHEATQLLFAVGLPEEEAILRKWLDDEGKREYVTAGQSRRVHERLKGKLVEAMKEAGVEPDVPDMSSASVVMYDELSRSGHNRRAQVLAAVSEPLRQMAVGYDADPLERAEFADVAVSTTLEAISVVGDALGLFYPGSGFVELQVRPLVEEVEATRRANPLDRDAIRAAADPA